MNASSGMTIQQRIFQKRGKPLILASSFAVSSPSDSICIDCVRLVLDPRLILVEDGTTNLSESWACSDLVPSVTVADDIYDVELSRYTAATSAVLAGDSVVDSPVMSALKEWLRSFDVISKELV